MWLNTPSRMMRACARSMSSKKSRSALVQARTCPPRADVRPGAFEVGGGRLGRRFNDRLG